MSAAISFENVVYQHQPQSSPLRLHAQFPRDKVTAIVGPSGSGKSTLLQLINGLLRPESGTVGVLGNAIDYAHVQSLRRKIGYMIQSAALFPHLTIQQNIGLASRIKGENVSEERIDALMAKMALPRHFKQRHPYQLSGGEQQRAVICMALYGKPQILLMDESLGSLDAITRVEIQNQLLALHAEEKYTTVMVTHDLQEALRFGDFLLVLNKGSIEAHGTPSEVQSSPSLLVQKLFAYSGNSQINIPRV
jgi:osmoprotectant transport system ATP-binding protein